MAKQRTFKVVFERDESGAWNVSVPEVNGCFTHGRTLAAARRRVREAIEVSLDGPNAHSIAKNAILVEDVRLPEALEAVIAPAVETRKELEAMQQRASATLGKAAVALVKAGLSTRDAADLLHVSHQRVHQLA
jgi:predicted RNase H-like HicB family nuclease